ncbi:MAG: hypothetical protein HND57_16185 [Planctomycetes bacterium]|nr:hypothetical protein [Planctomycetota bacterium]
MTNGAQWALAPEDYGEWEMPQAGERGAVRARRSGVEQTGGSEQQYYAINFDDLENRALKPSVGTYIFSLEFSDSSHGCVSLACFDVTATFPWGVGMNAPSITFAAELKRRFLARDDPAQWATSIGGTWVRTEDQERDPALRFYAWTGSKHLFDGAAHTVSASLRVNAGLNANGEEWYTLSLYQDGRLLGNAFDLEAQNALSRFQPTIRHFGCLYLVVYHYYAYFLPEISSPI